MGAAAAPDRTLETITIPTPGQIFLELLGRTAFCLLLAQG